jgi:hypothetical protein
VDDDGKRLEMDGYRTGDRFRWSVNDGDPRSHEMPVFPTNHWNPAVLSQDRVLNTLTGRINRVSIEPHGDDETASDGDVNRYRYGGELELESWYDDSGRWLGMSFEGRDGSLIEYRCGNCPAWRSL